LLLVDDNDDDFLFAKPALSEAQILHPIQTLADGQQAIDYLSGEGSFSPRRYPLPVLVLLDLKMPRKSGFKVFAMDSRAAFATPPGGNHLDNIPRSPRYQTDLRTWSELVFAKAIRDPGPRRNDESPQIVLADV
jgi:hypothetical protein